MSFNINGGAIVTTRVKLSGNSVTALFAATSRTTILSIIATENNGGTPTLTLDVYDGTNSFALRHAVAMVAGTAAIFSEPFELQAGYSIRATSSDASGHVDCHVSYINPVAARGGA